MLKSGKSYDDVYHSFKWKIPEYYNMGVDVCDKHAHQQSRLALIYENESGQLEKYTFWQLRRLSNQFANTLEAFGIGAGDRIGVLLPQCPETGIAHIAAYKIGGIAIPLFTLFGPDALEYRLANSEAKGIVTDEANLPKVLEIKDRLPQLKQIFVARGEKQPQVVDFWEALDKASIEFTPVKTRSEDPEFPHNFFPKEDDLFWTPADWAWLGGLTDVLLPSWHHGIPVVAFRAKKFDPEFAFYLMAKHGVRNSFIPPTALKLMRQVKNPGDRHKYQLRTVASGGETLGKELLEWGKSTLGLTINEFYGQTEVNLVVGNCAEIMEIRPGSMGKAIPGHVVEIVDDDGNVLPGGETGNVGIKHPDPVMFLEYWKKPEATREKYVKGWYLTGDMAQKDEDGYFWFVGREDDLITSAGYRIGPGEIEDCLIKHPAVALAAVIGSPDDVRGTIVKAFIVLKPEADIHEKLKDDIQKFIRNRLAAHEYPREIEFVDELPMTATGKIIRKKLREIDHKKKRFKK
jgi:acetyl-CoA synthetase